MGDHISGTTLKQLHIISENKTTYSKILHQIDFIDVSQLTMHLQNKQKAHIYILNKNK